MIQESNFENHFIIFANGYVGLKICEFLSDLSAPITALALPETRHQKYGDELRNHAKNVGWTLLEGINPNSESFTKLLRELRPFPTMGLSIFYSHIFKRKLISAFDHGILNLHPSLLPYNRGKHPNVWSIIDKTPAGVTIHLIDEEIDKGPILFQKEVPVLPNDTGYSLYKKLEIASIDLFKEKWIHIKKPKFSPISQTEAGTYHKKSDLESVQKIDLNRFYKASDLIDILRACTFPPYPGAYLEINGKKYSYRLSIEEI